MWRLDPVDYDFIDIPYASQVLFELYHTTDCVTKNEECFTVHVSHDGKALSLGLCLDRNLAKGSQSKICSYPDFKDYMTSIGTKGDVL